MLFVYLYNIGQLKETVKTCKHVVIMETNSFEGNFMPFSYSGVGGSVGMFVI